MKATDEWKEEIRIEQDGYWFGRITVNAFSRSIIAKQRPEPLEINSYVGACREIATAISEPSDELFGILGEPDKIDVAIVIDIAGD